MKKTNLIEATDASIRADRFRAELYIAAEKFEKDQIPHEEVLELLHSSFAMLGNLQKYVNEYRALMIDANNRGELPE